MDQIQAGRLLTLAYYLKTEVDPKQFDMEYWGRKWVEESKEDEPPCLVDLELGQQVKRKRVKEITCGTSACVLGWATVVFPQDLRMSWDGDEEEEAGCVQFKIGGKWFDVNDLSLSLHDFFGLTREESESLFADHWDATPKQKAKQIEQLVSQHGYTYAK